MSITIRPYQDADKPHIITLMRTFNEYIESIDTKKRTAYKEGGAEYFTDKMIQLCATKQGTIFVACDGDRPIGFISGYVDGQDEDEKMETIPAIPGVLGEFFVLENYRGQKVGKQLLAIMENYLRDQNCTIIRFPVFAPNSLARTFYEHEGYVERLIYVLKELRETSESDVLHR